MFALKKFAAILFLTLTICAPNVEAADKAKVAVIMDWDTVGAVSSADELAADYIVAALVKNGRFDVMDMELLKRTFSLASARKMAERNNIDYLIYGNFGREYNDFMIEKNFEKKKFQSVKAVLMLKMIDAKTGEVVAAARGEGISKRSELDAEDLKGLGEYKVPPISIHNAIKKAAFEATDKLVKNFSAS